MSAEDDRAAAYRVQQQRRLAYKIAQEAALRPSTVATRAVADGWRAWLEFDVNGVPRVGVAVLPDDPAEEVGCLP
jgi:hypothetical protein